MEGNLLHKVKNRFILNFILNIGFACFSILMMILIIGLFMLVPSEILLLILFIFLVLLLPFLMYMAILSTWKQSRKQVEEEVANE